MVELALKCYVHHRQRIVRRDEREFWDSHFMFGKLISQQKAVILRRPVRQTIVEDSIFFATYLNLYAADISFHQRAVHQTDVLGIHFATPRMIAESKRRVLTAACEIVNIVR
ncbi:hypothetical protein QBC36DRAFT_143931, partial [Triangularia setosa]